MNDVDPVEEFFARERRDIHPAPGDDGHWAAIVDAHRRSRRSRWTGFAAGAAAAAVLVGGVGYLLRPGDGTTALPGSRTGSTSTSLSSTPTGSATSPAGTSTSAPTSTATSRPVTVGVPADFRLVSVSQADNSTLFGLGITNCKGHACTQVVRSLDSGKSWRAVATFGQEVDTPGRTSSGKVGTRTSLTEIRMASPLVGWVFGAGVRQTTDGGFTWHPYAVPGGGVVSLETDGNTVAVAVATGSCDGSHCSGDLATAVADTTANGITEAQYTIPTSAPIRAADYNWFNGDLYLSLATDKGATAGLLEAKGWVTGTKGCAASGGVSRVVAPASGGTVFGICPGGAAAGSSSYGIVTRKVDGTWQQVVAPDSGALLLTNAGSTSFAAADSTHLLAVSGGDPAVHGSMKVSSDGGVAWHDPKSAPPVPDRGWAWVGSPGAGTYYAIPFGGSGVLWRSTDKGETWTTVQVAS